jgi:ribosomal protein L15
MARSFLSLRQKKRFEGGETWIYRELGMTYMRLPEIGFNEFKDSSVHYESPGSIILFPTKNVAAPDFWQMEKG